MTAAKKAKLSPVSPATDLTPLAIAKRDLGYVVRDLQEDHVELKKTAGEAILEVIDLRNLMGPMGQMLDEDDLDALLVLLEKLRRDADCLKFRAASLEEKLAQLEGALP